MFFYSLNAFHENIASVVEKIMEKYDDKPEDAMNDLDEIADDVSRRLLFCCSDGLILQELQAKIKNIVTTVHRDKRWGYCAMFGEVIIFNEFFENLHRGTLIKKKFNFQKNL